jgi:hypothetical protein
LILLGLVYMLPFVSFAVLPPMGLLVDVRFSSGEQLLGCDFVPRHEGGNGGCWKRGGGVNRSSRKLEVVRVRGGDEEERWIVDFILGAWRRGRRRSSSTRENGLRKRLPRIA